MSPRNQKGSSLVEALVSMALIMFSLLAVAPLFVHAERVSATDANMGYVGAAAVKRMELLDAASFPTLVVGGSLTANTVDAAGVPYYDLSNPDVVVRWSIAAGPTPGARTVRVRAVARRHDLGQAKSVTLVTVRGQ